MRYGHFDDKRREYVITTPRTPLPWINYLGCEAYFGIISNTAGGYSFYRDARMRRLTRYRYNNAPFDLGGRIFTSATTRAASSGRRPGSPRRAIWTNTSAGTAWVTPPSVPHATKSRPRRVISCRWARTWKSGDSASPTAAESRPNSPCFPASSSACGTPRTTPPTSSAISASARSRSKTG